MRAAWLIAGREFRAYAMTASFWVAAAMGPLLLGGGLLISKQAPPRGDAVGLSLSRGGDGTLQARFSEGFPASAEGRGRILAAVAREAGPVRLAEAAPPGPPAERRDPSRLALTVMLWITLTGSLGMLLQAVVRERANRSLESLLAATDPWSVVAGKILGVGAVSLLVVGVWLGSAVALGSSDAAAGGAMAAVLEGFADPLALARAMGIYLLAFLSYGFAIVGVGARARDSADAQNLARPVFATLLAVFFVVIGAMGSKLSWLVYLPPLTPFLLLLKSYPAAVEITALALLAAFTTLTGWLAGLALQPDGLSHLFRVRPVARHPNEA